MRSIIIIINILLLTGCHKDNNDVFPLKMNWKVLLHEMQGTSGTIEQYLLDNGVLFSSNPYLGDYRGYFLLNKGNGSLVWHWKDNIKELESHLFDNKVSDYQGRIIINNRRERYCIDQYSGKTIWKIRDDWDYGSDIQQVDNMIYCGRDLDYPNAELVRYTFHDPIPEILWENPTDSTNMREYDLPPAFTEQNGNTWMVFSDGFVNYDNGKGHPWLVCYNLTADSLIWRRQVSDAWFHAGIRIPLIHNNRIYVAESFHVVCLDLFTCEEIWRKTYGNQVSYTPLLLVNDQLFVACEDEFIDMVNPVNGLLLHHEEGSGGSASKMHYHKGKIYYVSGGDGQLHCLDEGTGKHLWTMEGPERQNDSDLSFDGAGLAIDPETDMLYITDYRYAYGYKILE
ncbi:MAG: PQQ-like beta-propeller repeat protein [Saprospiraceae bacterium]|nr:PQQ-like beta-propeller repeat protein [Saprospiraceae bacterium]